MDRSDRPHVADAGPLQLQMLGSVALAYPDGRSLESLLRQPKHIALLAYLASPAPGTWHRRDAVLAVFWPELDQARARAALRSALYTIRRQLPPGTIRTRGDEELGVDAGRLETDVAALNRDFAAARYDQALSRYGGELLQGVHVADAPGFEQWLASRRREVATVARKAASQLADAHAAAGRLDVATDAARRASELDPYDEKAARRWIALLDRAGDRAQAFAVYDRFRTSLADAFGVPPSAETIALLDAVRTRRAAAEPARDPQHEVQESAPRSVAPAGVATRHRSPRPRARAARVALLMAAVAVSGWLSLRGRASADSATPTRRLLVMPMANETGDTALAYIASGIADAVAKRLAGIGGLSLQSSARATLTTTVQQDLRAIARRSGADILVRSRVQRVADSLEVRVAVVDAVTLEERPLRVQRVALDGLRELESRLAADIAGAVLRVGLPAVPRRPAQPVHPESYRLMLAGWHQLLTDAAPRPLQFPTRRGLARDLFERSINLDPSNARAWSGLSSVYASQAVTDEISFEEGYERATAAALRAIALDSMEGSAWGNLAYMRALETRDLAVGMALLRRAQAAEPSNPELYLIEQNLLTSAHLLERARDAGRITRQLDPLAANYLDHEGLAELCLDRADAALALYSAALDANPSDRQARTGVTRSLARLGRFDEAIGSWHEQARAAGDTLLQRALAAARGREGYWSVRHMDGQRRLAGLNRLKTRISTLRVVQATFATGDTAAIRGALDRAMVTFNPGLLRLQCMPDVDEFRGTPTLDRALARIGTLETRM